MKVSRKTNPVSYHFDDVIIDGENFRIQKAGAIRTLTPRAFDVLLFLIERHKRVVEKQELFEQIWKETFVSDNALTRVIKEVRKALGDDAEAPLYIETVPKRGYRFIAELAQGSDAAALLRPDQQAITTAQESPPVMAVLPFKLFAADGDDEYLGIGMADALITRLSNSRQVNLRPTSAILRYAQPHQDPLAAGRELRVGAVLEGHIRKAGDRLRVTVQLVSVKDERALWAAKFDEKFTDIFTVEDAIAERVVEALALPLSKQEKHLLTKRYTEAVEAHEYYLKGRYYANKFSLENFCKAIEAFHRALDIDPDYALAYAGIAEAHWIAADLYLNPADALPKTREAAIKALAIDAELAEAHTYLAATKYSLEWDWAGLESEFRRALALNPGFAPAHQWYGWCLSVLGRHEEAIAELERAKQLDPFALGVNWFLSAVYALAGRYEEALEKARDLIELEPHFWAGHWALAIAYRYTGDYTAAILAYQKAGELGDSPMIKAALAEVYALAGQRPKAQIMLDELKELEKTSFVPPFYIALIHAALGENDPAFEYLEKAFEMRDSSLPLIKVDQRLDNLRPDPRLKDLLLRVGLTP
jgi:DNA-binding winged helix-turn-helix (wHTH) protein/tetratricopeptide (TPR) repeat protein